MPLVFSISFCCLACFVLGKTFFPNELFLMPSPSYHFEQILLVGFLQIMLGNAEIWGEAATEERG